MNVVVLVAIGIGCSTMIGSFLAFGLRTISEQWNRGMIGFTSGVMLTAALLGLVVPAVELIEEKESWMPFVGSFLGGATVVVLEKHAPSFAWMFDAHQVEYRREWNHMILLVTAIAIHNLPEGMAAGIAFGDSTAVNAGTVSIGIALQNIPEGMLAVSCMLLSGVERKRAMIIAFITGIIEIIGTFLGYFFAKSAVEILAAVLAFAAGCMIYVVGEELISQKQERKHTEQMVFSMLAGIILMSLINHWIELYF